MEDDTKPRPQSEFTDSDAFDTQIDNLLPVPSEDSEAAHGQVNGSIDTLLPIPGDESASADDATTREEMEVDTTADGVDDIIPLFGEDGGNADRDTDESGVPPMAISGTPVTWEPVADQPATIVDDEDYEPINQDSELIGSTYRTSSSEAQTGLPAPSTHYMDDETSPAHQCAACGAGIGNVPYCPQCGMDQFPSSRVSAVLSHLLSWSRPLQIRAILLVAAFLALVALLTDSGATALAISAITMPVVLMVRISMQVREHAYSGWVQAGMLAFIGFAGGMPLAWFAARMVKRSWFDTGVLNFGAAGFGGNFAHAAGVPPFIIWLVVGFLIPIVIILGVGAAAVALRMVLTIAPRETTGMFLSGAVAAGYVVASGIIFYQPLSSELAPRMSTSEWTLTIFGLAVIRPLIWVFSGAMIGGVVWRYLRTASLASITVPLVIALVLPFGFGLLSLAASPAGHWAEIFVGLIFALAVVFFYRRFLTAAIRNDASLSMESHQPGI